MIFIIAEAGINHGGNMADARQLIKAAKRAGANAVKFQMFNSRLLWGDDRITHLELSKEQIVELYKFAGSMEIEFMCTPFDEHAVGFLHGMGIKRMKVASGCLTNNRLLLAINNTRLPVILSTGMSNRGDISHALGFLDRVHTLLHCTSAYPCPVEDVHLKAMVKLGKSFHLPVGYSDHTSGLVVSLAAAALGATVIEKHLTLDRTQEGPDHKASIEPHEFAAMVTGIREIEQALGDAEKRVQPSESQLRRLWRTSH